MCIVTGRVLTEAPNRGIQRPADVMPSRARGCRRGETGRSSFGRGCVVKCSRAVVKEPELDGGGQGRERGCGMQHQHGRCR